MQNEQIKKGRGVIRSLDHRLKHFFCFLPVESVAVFRDDRWMYQTTLNQLWHRVAQLGFKARKKNGKDCTAFCRII